MSLARLHPVVLVVLCPLSASAFATEAPLSADAYVSTASPAANYGATSALASTLLRFDLSALPERAGDPSTTVFSTVKRAPEPAMQRGWT